jgi:hypothetical protein
MPTEMGEYLVGAYLKLILKCGVVDYNVRPPGGGLQGLGELDVIGFDFAKRTAYICEITTHLDGLLIPNAEVTVEKLRDKHRRQKIYADQYLKGFTARYMFWSPVVRSGLVSKLKEIGFDLFVNEAYSEAIGKLRDKARVSTSDVNNAAFRVLQILEHLRPIARP